MRRATAGWVAAAATMAWASMVAVQGCGGSSNTGLFADGGVASVPVTADQFASAYAHAVCDDLAGCCTANGYGFNGPGCIAAVEGLAQAELINPATVAGAKYDPNAAGECVARARKAAQSCAQTDDEKRASNVACGRIYAGTKRPGEACKSAMECATAPEGRVSCSSWFSGDGGTSGSQCLVRKSPASVGDTCDFGSGGAPAPIVGDCTTSTGELRCDSATRTCQPRIALGQKCTAQGSCTLDAYCNYKAQVCEARLAVGQSCTGSDECNAQTYCDYQATKTCLGKKATGADCQSSQECTSNSCKKTKCVANAMGTPELCGGAPR